VKDAGERRRQWCNARSGAAVGGASRAGVLAVQRWSRSPMRPGLPAGMRRWSDVEVDGIRSGCFRGLLLCACGGARAVFVGKLAPCKPWPQRRVDIVANCGSRWQKGSHSRPRHARHCPRRPHEPRGAACWDVKRDMCFAPARRECIGTRGQRRAQHAHNVEPSGGRVLPENDPRLQPFSRKSRTPTAAKEFQIGL